MTMQRPIWIPLRFDAGQRAQPIAIHEDIAHRYEDAEHAQTALTATVGSIESTTAGSSRESSAATTVGLRMWRVIALRYVLVLAVWLVWQPASLAVTPMAAAGEAYTAALKTDGSLWTWGNNQFGQLGGGNTANTSTPNWIGSDYASVAAGRNHTVAIKTDGSLWAWGYNYYGQLGDGTTTDTLTPKRIGSGYAAVAAGVNHTMALKTDGSLWAWGSNECGSLGDGTTTDASTPKQIGTGYAAVASRWRHTVAVKSDGSLWGWGYNGQGELGVATTDNCYGSSSTLIPMQIGTGYLSVAVGEGHTVAIKTDGSLWAWGLNYGGQLGDGSTNIALTPKLIGTGFASVAAGSYHTVAVKADGSLWAWGNNYIGQLGVATTDNCYGANCSKTPKQIGTGYASVSANGDFTLALKTDGSLWAWGGNGSGQLGDGTTANRLSPVQIFNLIATGPALVGVSISPSAFQLTAGNSSTLSARATYGDGSSKAVTPVWSSSNALVATVNSAGSVSAQSFSAGSTATITASYTEGGVTRTATVSLTVVSAVTPSVQLSTLSINGGSSVLAAGASMTLAASATYSDGANRTVTALWSSNSAAVSVSSSGQATAALAATNTPATVTASYTEGGVTRTASLNLTVTASTAARVTSISIQGSKEVPEGGTTMLRVVATYSDSSTKSVSANWSSSNPSLVSVGATGALTVGLVNADTTVTLTASYTENGPSVSQSFDLTVKNVATALSYLTISGASSVFEGQATTLTATAHYTDLSSRAITPQWRSSDSAVALVSESGVVTAGQVTASTTIFITAAYNETGVSKEHSTTITVKDVAATTISATPALGMGFGHSIALRNDGSVWSWGWSVFGQSGTGETRTRSTPVRVSGIDSITSIGVGAWHNLALKADGTVWAWGKNALGGLGDGSTDDRQTPIQVRGVTGVKALAAGLYHSLALKTDGSGVMAWGSNSAGQLGDGTNVDLRLSPVTVPGLSAVAAVAAGQNRSFALKTDGTLWGWGDLGGGALYSPVQIAQLLGIKAIAAGWNHTLALKDDGTVWAWGDNDQGQLGDGSRIDRSAPVQARGLANVIAIAAGVDHSVAVKSDGSVWSWGGNGQGQLGNGNSTAQLTPQAATNLDGAASASAGLNYSIVVKNDGVVWGAGNNVYGQLGDGSFVGNDRFSPVQDADQAKLFDLAPNQAKDPVPGDKVPTFYMKSEKSGDEVLDALFRVSNLSLETRIPTSGNGFSATYQMFVVVFVPGGKPGLMTGGSRGAPVSADALFCKVEASGWQPCGTTEVPPYRAGVNPSGVGDIALSVLESTDLTGMSGAQFYVGYGTSASEMLSAGRYRVMYRVP